MRRKRIWIVCVLLGVSLFEVYLVVAAQDRATPWPPPPVRRSADEAEAPPPRPVSDAGPPPKPAPWPPPPYRGPRTDATKPAPRPVAVQQAPSPIVPVAAEASSSGVVRAVGQEPALPPVTNAAAEEPKRDETPPPTFPPLPAVEPAAPRAPALPEPTPPVERKDTPPAAPNPLPAAPLEVAPPPLPATPVGPAPALVPDPVPAPSPVPAAPALPQVTAPAPAPTIRPAFPVAQGAAPLPAPVPEKLSAPIESEVSVAPPPPPGPRPRELTRVRPQSRPDTLVPTPVAPSGPEVLRAHSAVPAPVAPEATEPHGTTLPRIGTLTPDKIAAMAAVPAAWSFQTPRLLVEKRGPTTMQPGETRHFHITVRNPSEERLTGLLIEEALPPQVRAVGAEPAAVVREGRVSWTQPALGPREEITLIMTVQANAAVQMGQTTAVALTAVGGTPVLAGSVPTVAGSSPVAEVRPSVAALAVQMQGPANVGLGQPAVFKISFTNQGAQPLRNLKLFGLVPEGLQHPMGAQIEADVPELAAGATRTETLTTTARAQGKYTVQVRILSPAGGEASAQCAVEVSPSGLRVQQASGTRLAVGRETEVVFEVANQTGLPLRTVNVVCTLPEGVRFVKASDRGMYQETSRSVYWILDQLPAGQAKALAIIAEGKSAGQYAGEVVARAEGVPEAKAPATLAVEGFPELTINVADHENPLALGKTPIYEIKVANPGSAAATNVSVQVAFPEGLMPMQGHGPTRFAILPQEVRFEPLPHLPGLGQFVPVYKVSARAMRPGEHRVRVTVSSDQVRVPVTRELIVQVPAAPGWTPPGRN